jgi:hypothetical protein
MPERNIVHLARHTRAVLADWRDDYNTVRSHSGLGNLPPAVYAKRSAPVMQRDGTLRYTELRAASRCIIHQPGIQ